MIVAMSLPCNTAMFTKEYRLNNPKRIASIPQCPLPSKIPVRQDLASLAHHRYAFQRNQSSQIPALKPSIRAETVSIQASAGLGNQPRSKTNPKAMLKGMCPTCEVTKATAPIHHNLHPF